MMKEAIVAEGGPFALFGGEPLLVPEADLEDLWSWGFANFGGNAVQTNGTLINDQHMHMFKEYNVQVGISIDGPRELNDARWYGTRARTREATAKTERAIERLCLEKIPISIIITLNRCNARPDRLSALYEWVAGLDKMGVKWVRLHLLESETTLVRSKYGLSESENIEAMLGLHSLQKRLRTLSIDTFTEMRRLLLGKDENTACVWNACDPYTTAAVRGVEGRGERSNCGRTNKDGIDFGKGNVQGFERYIALYTTSQECGGCQGCRFFLMCKGQCPGTAIDGDWRNRTEHCGVWKTLFSYLEKELLDEGVQTLSLSAERENIEMLFLSSWSRGQMTFLSRLQTASLPTLPGNTTAALPQRI
jgi:uncharacterized protein